MLSPSGATGLEGTRSGGRSSLTNELAVERALVHGIVKGIAIAVPIMTTFFVGLIALAVGPQHPEWPAWLGMGVGIGVLAGTFFGAWAGFVASTHTLDELDRVGDDLAVVDTRTSSEPQRKPVARAG